MRRTGAVLIALVTVVVSGGLVAIAPMAAADTATFTDRLNDARRGVDIERVRVDNGRRILVTVHFDKLNRRSSGLAVYFDTRGPDAGPEYVAAGGLSPEGSDWQAVRIENWRGGNAHLLLRCDIDMRIRRAKDTVTFDIARGCFNRPDRIRVAAQANGRKVSQHDWAPKRHRFYDWVRR